MNTKVMLHYWSFTRARSTDGQPAFFLSGNISGHSKIPDTRFVSTSKVSDIDLDIDNEELIAKTKNTVYHCPLSYADWEALESKGTSELLPNYDQVKKRFFGKIDKHTIEAGNVLLVVSDFDRYFYHSIYCKPSEDTEIFFRATSNIGMIQDSFLICGSASQKTVDLRYFPHPGNIEFYTLNTDGMPLWVENIGRTSLYIQAEVGIIKLEPGSRKQVCKEESEDEVPHLSEGDLYPPKTL